MARRSTNVKRLEVFLGNEWRAWEMGQNNVSSIEGSDGIYTISGEIEGAGRWKTVIHLDIIPAYTVL